MVLGGGGGGGVLGQGSVTVSDLVVESFKYILNHFVLFIGCCI